MKITKSVKESYPGRYAGQARMRKMADTAWDNVLKAQEKLAAYKQTHKKGKWVKGDYGRYLERRIKDLIVAANFIEKEIKAKR